MLQSTPGLTGRLDISWELSARRMIHMKYIALYSQKKKKKKMKKQFENVVY